jgi:SAM-dependent methyltransferase
LHKDAYLEMQRILYQWHDAADVLDVGSYNVNGSYRPIVNGHGWNYTGVDIVPGKNVDIVSDSPYRFPFDDGAFDIVISGSVMEHVEAVWEWVPELARLIRPGGMLAIITHTHWIYHPHPVDCWRIMPDGMRFLFDLTGVLEGYDIQMYNDTDISAVAYKVNQ